MDKPVVTRFAPSPTGYLHIGGARTALFNYLFTKKHKGRFLLRIEDTDRARSTDEAVEAILEGLSWLGLSWDGEPVYQHKQEARHTEVVAEILKKGKAYYCYCTPQELEAMRTAAKEKGLPMRYDGRWRDRDASDAPKDVPPVIRFRAPREGVTVIDDKVQGSVSVNNSELDDLVLARSDGTPTYNLAVVVDDHDMGVTHVIRGDDHFTNAFRQSQIIEALGWERPTYAHIPLIHGADGAKLSKRHGATAVGDYRQKGYLPQAFRNYLSRLGWSHGDDEIFTSEQAAQWFTLEAIGRAPARFDQAKLDHLNHHYLALAPVDEVMKEVEWLLKQKTGQVLDDRHAAMFMRALPSLTTRASTLATVIEEAGFISATRPLVLTAAAEKTLQNAEARPLLKVLRNELAALAGNDWSRATLEGAVRAFVEARGIKLGDIAQPLRMALSGGHPSPGVFDMMSILGPEESLARIDAQTP